MIDFSNGWYDSIDPFCGEGEDDFDELISDDLTELNSDNLSDELFNE